MGEGRRNKTAFLHGEYFNRSQSLLLEGGDIGRGAERFLNGVIRHVKISETELTHRGVCGRELRRLNEAVYQVLGHFPAGLVMLCKTVEILFLSEEILIELREQFHEIMVHIGTAQTLVLCLGRQTVESVTEFMQERLNLVGIEKHRVAACRFREIADNRNQRYRLVTLVIFCLGTEFSHPGTRTLAGTIEEIGIKDTEKLSVILVHIVDSHIGMIFVYLSVLLELVAIEFGGEPEHSVNRVVQFEIWFQLLLVERIAGVFQLVGPIGIIPWF